MPPYVSFGDLRGGKAGGPAILAPATTRSTSRASAAAAKGSRPPTSTSASAAFSCPTASPSTTSPSATILLKQFDQGFRTLDGAGDLVDGLDEFHRQALEILRSDKTKKAFNLNQEAEATRERYGTTASARALWRLGGWSRPGVRFVTVSLGGWDTHEQELPEPQDKLLPPLDQTLSALIARPGRARPAGFDDRHAVPASSAGRRRSTRTPAATTGPGRWRCVLAGGGLKRGYVHGSTDANGMVPATDPCSPDDIGATIFHCLGIDPKTELQAPTGRPMQLFREGKVIEKLIS